MQLDACSMSTVRLPLGGSSGWGLRGKPDTPSTGEVERVHMSRQGVQEGYLFGGLAAGAYVVNLTPHQLARLNGFICHAKVCRKKLLSTGFDVNLTTITVRANKSYCKAYCFTMRSQSDPREGVRF